jgi:beta-lactamase regulating signal transducer with metallopeptidase domain
MFLVLTVGVAAIVGLTALVGRFVRSAAWQRTVWQVCMLAVIALVLVEWTGTGRGLVHSFTAGSRTRATSVPAVQEPERSCATVVPAVHPTSDSRATAVSAVPDSDEPSLDASIAIEGFDDSYSADVIVAHARDLSSADAAETRVAGVVWWLAALWALGSAVLIGRLLWVGLRLRAFRRRAVPVGEAIERRVAALAERLAFHRPVRVLAADRLRVPVAFGVVRPTLVIPAAFDADFDPHQQEAVLAHELAHLAAGDPGWHLSATWACSLLWWHPLVWWMRRQLRAASEAAADEVSLVVHNGPSVLAECLVALGKRLSRRPHLGWLSVDGDGFRSGLGRRVERLLQLRTRPWQSPRRGRTMLAKCVLPVSLVFLAVSCTAWAQPQVPFSEGGTTMNVLRSSWRCSLVATALWAMLGPAQATAAESERPRERPKADAERGDRKEGDAREGARPRKEGDAREERREKKDGDAREVARPRKEGGDREGERARPVAREGEGRARPSPEAQMEQRRKLEEMARDLRARLEQLKPDQDAEAKEIKQKLERVSNALRDMQGARRDRPGAEAEQRLEQIKRHIAELKAAGKHDEAERVAREAREMMQRLQGAREGDQKRPNAEIAERLEQMKRRIAELKAAGKNDEAERVAREAREMMQRLQGAREGDKKRPDAAALERLEQLKRRAAELKAAGKHDEAMAVAREASELAQRLKGARDGDQKRPDKEAPRAGAQNPEVQALRNEVQQMRRDMQEMREMMKKLMERERK